MYILGGDGTILFRALWANDTAALESALASIVADKPLRRTRSGGLVLPVLRMLPDIAPALDRAGRGAWADMWLVASPLAAPASVLKRLFIVLLGAFIVIVAAQLLRGHDLPYSALHGSIWAVITATVFTVSRYFQARRGQHCAICRDTPEMQHSDHGGDI